MWHKDRKKQHSSVIFIWIIILVGGFLAVSQQDDAYERFRGEHLILAGDNKALFWFHGIHSNDPEHRMFDDIKQELTDFKPDLVLVEGGADSNHYESEREAILRGGESSYVAYLAKESSIELLNIEPSDQEIFSYLLETHSQEEVLAMYLLRQIYQKQREAEHINIDFDAYFIRYIEHMSANGFPLEQVTIDINYISKVLEPFIGYEVTEKNWLDIDAGQMVYFGEGIIHQVWQETANFRDQHCVDLIADSLATYDRIFVMMGFDHAEAQEESLRDIFAAYQ